MELTFLYPWLAYAAAIVAAGGCALAFARKKANALLVLGAAALLVGSARPQFGAREPEVRHALVIDVSGSMASRPEVLALVDGIELPAGHSFVRYELSDTLRVAGSASGENTDYVRLADIATDSTINGEVVLITDGRGRLADLYSALDASRLILLRAPQPIAPDAALTYFSAPSSVGQGGIASLHATVICDKDALVPWRLMAGPKQLAAGNLNARAGLPAKLHLAQPLAGSGVMRLMLVLELTDDRERRNDRAGVAIAVGAKHRIEYCTQDVVLPGADALLGLLNADAANEVNVRHTLPAGAELEGTALVVINNLSVALSHASGEQMAALADWARSGGNLLMLGTDSAFGPGGYRGTAIEDVMPVRFRPDDSPPRKLLMLLDSSASMQESLSGGVTRLDRLKEGARRVLATLDEYELAAVIGFRERALAQPIFLPPTDRRLEELLGQLTAQGSTHIATSLDQAVASFETIEQHGRILMVTDGEDVEGAGQARYEAIGNAIAARGLRLDIVLTESRETAWVGWLGAGKPDLHVWQGSNFDDLLETLDRAIADGDSEWVLTQPTTVAGVVPVLPRLVRTAPRDDASATTNLSASSLSGPARTYPLLAQRQLLGRTACLCTDSLGDAAMAAFWGDPTFGADFYGMLDFLLAHAGAMNIVLNPLADGAELVWTGQAQAPTVDLETSAGIARIDRPGRWLFETWPAGEELRVFKDGALLQRISLPELVRAEFQRTGDDEAWFAMASEGGIRVLRNLEGWAPRRMLEGSTQTRDMTWIAALAGIVLLLSGFALRRR